VAGEFVAIVSHMTAPEHLDAVLERVAMNGALMDGQPGMLDRMAVTRRVDDEIEVLSVTRWESEAAHDAYRDDKPALPPAPAGIYLGKPERRFYDQVG
jgi:heme-degrading monooxygenase HmoA